MERKYLVARYDKFAKHIAGKIDNIHQNRLNSIIGPRRKQCTGPSRAGFWAERPVVRSLQEASWGGVRGLPLRSAPFTIATAAMSSSSSH